MKRNYKPEFLAADENAALRVILEGTATDIGERFFETLVENLSKAMNTHSAWVTEYLQETRQLRALAFWSNGQLMEDLVFDLEGTPCGAVIDRKTLVHYPENILSIYPNNLTLKQFKAVSYMGVPLINSAGIVTGHLAVLDTQPMPEDPRAETILRIFSARASAELQRIKAESRVRKSEEKFRRIIETTGEGFMLTDKYFVITDANDAFCRLLGYNREEVIGKTPFDFATEEFRQFLMMNKADLFYEKHGEFEGTLITKDGGIRHIRIYGNLLRNDREEILGYVSFVVDMTEQKRSLALAGEVQKNLLPQQSPQIEGLDVAGKTLSCEEIGGDYFDFLVENDGPGDHLNVVVGDVTGHGVAAALLMASARAFLRMQVLQCGSISQLISEMNRYLVRDVLDTGRFMTVFFAHLDVGGKNIQWVRAGHPPAVVYDSARDSFRELKGTGVALGVDEDHEYEESSEQVGPGQIIAIGSDGIWEVCNKSGEPYGMDRFCEVIRENASSTAQDIVAAVYESIKAFTMGLKQGDDITLVIVKVKGKPDSADDWQI